MRARSVCRSQDSDPDRPTVLSHSLASVADLGVSKLGGPALGPSVRDSVVLGPDQVAQTFWKLPLWMVQDTAAVT